MDLFKKGKIIEKVIKKLYKKIDKHGILFIERLERKIVMENIRDYIEAGIRTNEIEGFIFTEKEKKFLEKVSSGKISLLKAENIILNNLKDL